MQARKIKDLGQIPVGAKVYTWAKNRETGRLWDAPKGLIIRKKKKAGLMEGHLPRTGRAVLS